MPKRARLMWSLLLITFLFAPASFAEADSALVRKHIPRNTLSIEIGGVGVAGSLNYERLFSNRYIVRLGYTGFSSNLVNQLESSGWIVGASYLIPVGTWAARHGGAYEIGMAVAKTTSRSSVWFSNEVEHSSTVAASAHAGYSYRPVGGGVFFRLSLAPILFWRADGVAALPWVGISIGGAF